MLVAMALGTVAACAFAAGPARADGRQAAVTARGSVVFSNLPASQSTDPGLFGPYEIRPNDSGEDDSPTATGKVHIAKIDPRKTNRVSSSASGVITSFPGLNHRQQRLADAGNQFSLEPPDQALCVGHGFVIESVNLALRIHTTAGTPVGNIVSINQFFKLPSTFVRPAGPFGPFTSDPKCYYDPDTGRYFVTVLEADTNPVTSDFTGPTAVLIAVSQSSNPTGGWNLFSINTTDDGTGGTPSHPGCPCLGDQPLIGADATGFYVTTNEFTNVKQQLAGAAFNGAQVYALSKRALEMGIAPPVVQFESPPIFGDVSFSIQPATTPTGRYEGAASGTEYFLSSLDFSATSAKNIAVWALTNTMSLASPSPNVKLSSKVIESQLYGQPPDAAQKSGPAPLRDCLNLAACSTAFFGGPDPAAPEPFSKLAGNDDRMNQVVFANGRLWSGVNTAVQFSRSASPNVGVAFFVVRPKVDSRGSTVRLDAELSNSGYTAVAGNNVMYPSIGVNDAGDAVMALTLVGPDYYPSAAYTSIGGRDDGDGHGNAPVRIAAAGLGPDDGFTGYQFFTGGNSGRWGDYSAAVAAADGTIWMAAEYIGQTCTLAQALADGFSCGGTRTQLANWGTYISHIDPSQNNGQH